MKCLLVLLATVVVTLAFPSEHNSLWKNFKINHDKAYKTIKEERARFKIFTENLRKIEEHNARYEAGLETYKMGINQFADLTQEEFVRRLGFASESSFPRSIPYNIHQILDDVEPPKSIDWRTKGAVNPVRNQGDCLSCWAFSSVAVIEGMHFLKTGKLLKLSEQNLVDCAGYGSMGCWGGLVSSGYKYTRDKGLESASDYPYVGDDTQCIFNKSKSIITISGYTRIPADEDALLHAVATVGPVSVAVDSKKWQHYTSGIFSTDGGYGRLNHAVVVVGYGTEDGKDYWIVRNSMGASWGEKGYIRVARGSNQVGISDEGSYPNP